MLREARGRVAPLWAGIYMIPLLAGFLLMGPLSGWLSDRFGARLFSTLGMLIQALGFLLLALVPLNFQYTWFALILFIVGIGQGMFSSPNTSSVMGSNVQQALSAAKRTVLLGHAFFPYLISYPMSLGLHSVFYLSVIMSLVAAFASLLRGKAQIVTRET